MRVRLVALTSLAFGVIAASGTAHAGRTFYGWLYGTEVMPERGAEIQTFIAEENRYAGFNGATETDWWIAPAIGVTDQLELVLPVEMDWTRSDDEGARFTLTNYGAEVRYRMVTADPVDAPAFVPLVRVAVKRIVTGTRDHWQPEADLVASYTVGGVQALIDLGGTGEIGPDFTHFEFHPGAGFSIEAVNQLRLGAEVFSTLSFDDNGDGSWVAAGPNLSWSHGRTWVSAAYGIGLYHIRDAPKLQWGIAF